MHQLPWLFGVERIMPTGKDRIPPAPIPSFFPLYSRWKDGMQQEYDALMQNQTWHLVPPSSNKNLIDCK
jgi:hypothetical protein